MFHFKKFSLSDEKSAMKVGMDAVLLGAWAMPPVSGNILDIGTGTGILALMMAQRCNSRIDAVEINQDAADEAVENVKLSPWSDRITVYSSPIQTFANDSPAGYELILCNPPFFSKSLKSPLENRNTARHDDMLPVNQLMEVVNHHLSFNGRFCLIIPSDFLDTWTSQAPTAGLKVSRSMAVISRLGKSPNRHLLEFQHGNPIPVESTLVVRDAEGRYTNEYKQLTFDFYLAL